MIDTVTISRENAKWLKSFVETVSRGESPDAILLWCMLELDRAVSSPPQPSGLPPPAGATNDEMGRFCGSQPSELRDALEPFAAFADPRSKIPENMPITQGSQMARKQLTMGDCYRARAALASSDDGQELREALTPIAKLVVDLNAAGVPDGCPIGSDPERDPIATVGHLRKIVKLFVASPDDGWVKVDEEHPLPNDLKVGDEVICRYQYANVDWPYRGTRATHYRRRPSVEQAPAESRSAKIARLQREIGDRQMQLQFLVCGDPMKGVSFGPSAEQGG